MADAEFPVYRSDANEPEEENPWEKHAELLHDREQGGKTAAKTAVTKNNHDESARQRHERLEQMLNREGKRKIETAKSVPPGLLGSMENPGIVLDE